MFIVFFYMNLIVYIIGTNENYYTLVKTKPNY